LKHINEVILVEGRYDKNAVLQVVCGTVIETSGFSIFNEKEKLKLIRRLAGKNGLIILTDSDRAGFFIRGKLKGIFGDLKIKNAYIPDIPGKEKRKKSSSSENKLGVEAMHHDIILNSLKLAGATFSDEKPGITINDKITKTDLYDKGLTGKKDSAKKRRDFMKILDLPERLSTNGFIDVLNALYTKQEFLTLCEKSIYNM